MTQEDKELLIKDLSTKLPYGVKIKTSRGIYTVDAVSSDGLFSIQNEDNTLDDLIPYKGHYWLPIADDYKSYLRPMSSMTEKEKEEYKKVCELDTEILSKHPMDGTPFPALYNSQDWLNSKKFDYRGLIPKGLALPAPKEMYN